jgi:hypothetical protein
MFADPEELKEDALEEEKMREHERVAAILQFLSCQTED